MVRKSSKKERGAPPARPRKYTEKMNDGPESLHQWSGWAELKIYQSLYRQGLGGWKPWVTWTEWLYNSANTYWYLLCSRSFITGVPNLWDLRWSWCDNNRNKVHNKCNVLESSWNGYSPSPWSMEKLSSMKPVPGAKKIGDHCLISPNATLFNMRAIIYICLFEFKLLK